jgi:hypothetical protein
MIRAIFWKEWHEHRSKYIGYWLTVHAPIFLVTLGIAVSSYARIPFADLSDATVMKYLPMTLVQAFFGTTIFLILTGYLAVATFGPEVDERSLFFMYEQPLSRNRYLAIKVFYGLCHVLLATWCAVLLFPVVGYALMLISGKATVAGSGGVFLAVLSAAVRSAVWCSLIALAGFMTSVLVSALVPRWWLAAICSVVLTVVLINQTAGFFDFTPDIGEGTMSVGMSFSTGNSPWVTISRALTLVELKSFGRWHPWPLLTAVGVVLVCWAASTWLYGRKELR